MKRIMSSKLDLSNILAALKEVTEPYQLGIQLEINSSILKAIERNHPRDIDRQKTEMIEYWLRNSPDASWTTLANGVEGMGGYANVVETLREKEQNNEEIVPSSIPQMLSRQANVCFYQNPMHRSGSFPLDACVRCNILLLGNMSHGKSTLGNRLLNSDGCFKINDQLYPQTSEGSSVLRSVSQLKDYKVQVYDHAGLFEGASSIDHLSYAVPCELNLVIFVLKRGHSFNENEMEILVSVTNKWRIGRISALVLTHCECLSEEEREKIIDQFKKDHPSIAELMGKGILAVGFPDNSYIQPGSHLSHRVEDDKKKLRQLIYSCNAKVKIMRYRQPLVLPHPEHSKTDFFYIGSISDKIVTSNHTSYDGCRSSQHPITSLPENNDHSFQVVQRESDCKVCQHQQAANKSIFCSVM